MVACGPKKQFQMYGKELGKKILSMQDIVQYFENEENTNCFQKILVHD